MEFMLRIQNDQIENLIKIHQDSIDAKTAMQDSL